MQKQVSRDRSSEAPFAKRGNPVAIRDRVALLVVAAEGHERAVGEIGFGYGVDDGLVELRGLVEVVAIFLSRDRAAAQATIPTEGAGGVELHAVLIPAARESLDENCDCACGRLRTRLIVPPASPAPLNRPSEPRSTSTRS